ncbi:MAG: ABC transporter ATP-binding protein [Telmatospirillum sp.]|nr:ABC transporter ATP-binding protein [Telmatospirillum sp.]
MYCSSRPALLTVDHLSMRFGGLFAVNDLGFTAYGSEITAIIGPNGAGKTTLFNCLTGFYKPSVGRIALTAPGAPRFLLERMDGYRIARDARVARTFQNIRLFPGMSVLENLLVGQHTPLMRASRYSLAGLLGLRGYRLQERRSLDTARYWLDRTGLTAQADQPAGSLPYGSQRRLEIARAMCTEPALLCLDEPAAGLNPRESLDLNQLILDIRQEQGIGILLIEHDMSVVMTISDHVIVLDHGSLIADDDPAGVRCDPAVIRAYLGTAEDEDLPTEVAADLNRTAAGGRS